MPIVTIHESSMENMSTDLVDILLHLSKARDTPKSRTRKSKTKRRADKNPWYSPECRNLKSDLNRAQKSVKRHPFNEDLRNKLFSIKKRYNKVCKNTERKFREMITAKLLSIEQQKPTEFWNLVKKIKTYGKPNSKTENNIHPGD